MSARQTKPRHQIAEGARPFVESDDVSKHRHHGAPELGERVSTPNYRQELERGNAQGDALYSPVFVQDDSSMFIASTTDLSSSRMIVPQKFMSSVPVLCLSLPWWRLGME
jgi:hypothetical protein